MNNLSRIRGCLLAGACGDALGYQVEFDSGRAIRQRFGSEGVRDMDLTGGVAQISDDTQMTLFTAEGMLCALRHGEDAAACVHQAYLDWLHTQFHSAQPGRFHEESLLLRADALHSLRAPGNTCLGALRSGTMGTLDQPINQSMGCGGVMRAAPAGMLRLMDAPNPEDAFALQGAAFAAITHGHPLGWLPAAMLADMVRLCLTMSEASLSDIASTSLDRLRRLWGDNPHWNAFEALMRRAMALAREHLPDEEAIGELGEGWVGDEAMAIALYCCLKHPYNMENCLSAAVTHGGDSDSTGAVAGNLLGAHLGEKAIPARWLEHLEAREIIERMATLLAEADP